MARTEHRPPFHSPAWLWQCGSDHSPLHQISWGYTSAAINTSISVPLNPSLCTAVTEAAVAHQRHRRQTSNAKKRHYSYDCKAAPQERPYVPRPSRTQQLFNPKLLPKLSNEVPDALMRKKGVADEELAKKEAERARKRELEGDEEFAAPGESSPKRRRSPSYDSVSSFSTRSPSPVPLKRISVSPRRERRRDSPGPSHHRPAPQARRRSLNPEDRYLSRASESPARHHRHHHRHGAGARLPAAARRSPSLTPPPRKDDRASVTRRDYSPSPSPSQSRSLSRSRSPSLRRDDNYRDRDDASHQRGRVPQQRVASPLPPPPPPAPARERSLSPFSKRLALTQAMNLGR
ncbi:hypothetical protein B0T17DRAFT_503147 [Bombardia bombarda]|uniref:Uncharacterized protein n=1 Tax=Bombardia bombarda TaxID=252184 RepID=A0AA39XL40_9PEZI|nr:hypothetical protein B0T17DRAFT_503147 [Bombardia bombarda]